MPPSPGPASRPTGARVLGSFLAVGLAWVGVFLLLLGWIVLGMGGDALRGSVLALALTTAIPVFGVWLVLLLPLTMIIPADSIFWRPAVCTLAGMLLGTAAALLIPRSQGLGLVGAIIGGIVFLAASLAARRFR